MQYFQTRLVDGTARGAKATPSTSVMNFPMVHAHIAETYGRYPDGAPPTRGEQ